MNDHISFQLVMDQLECCGVGHINSLGLGKNKWTDVLLAFDLIDEGLTPTRRGWRVLAAWWAVDPHWEDGLPPCVSPSCIAYFEDYAETAGLLSTGTFKLHKESGGFDPLAYDEGVLSNSNRPRILDTEENDATTQPRCGYCGSTAHIRDANVAEISGRSWVDCDDCSCSEYRLVTSREISFEKRRLANV